MDELDTFAYQGVSLNNGDTNFDRDLIKYYSEDTCKEAFNFTNGEITEERCNNFSSLSLTRGLNFFRNHFTSKIREIITKDYEKRFDPYISEEIYILRE